MIFLNLFISKTISHRSLSRELDIDAPVPNLRNKVRYEWNVYHLLLHA